MRVLLYSANFAPEPVGIGKYSGELAQWMAACGHEVRVVAAPPYYPQWRVGDAYRGSLYRRERRDGVDVWRAGLWVPAKPGALTRILHLLSFAATSLPLMLWQTRWRPDVVLTVAPAIVCAPGGWLASKLCGAKSWLHVQDFEVDVAYRMGLLKTAWLGRAVAAVERSLFRRFDRVSSISRRMLQAAGAKGVSPPKLVLFPNWVDTNAIRPLQPAATLRRELGLADDAVVALYSGSFGGKQGLDLIPEAARLLAHVPKLVFVVCGDGVMRPQLEAAAARLPNLRILPLQPCDRLGALLSMADIHLLPQCEGAEDLVMPSKLGGMLASGRPTVSTCRPDTEIAHALDDCGVIVPPGNVEAFAVAIEQLARAPERRAELGLHARRRAEEQLAKDIVLGRLLDDLQSLVDGTAPRLDAAVPASSAAATALGVRKSA